MSMSNRARRMAAASSRATSADAELNLIPLIDILSVMVAFLLVYSTEVEVIQNTKGIEIPQSIAEATPQQVGGGDDHQGRPVRAGRAHRERRGRPRRHRTPIIEPLRAALKRPMLVGSEMTAKRPRRTREITVMGDKALPYEVLKKVMSHLHGCGLRQDLARRDAEGKARAARAVAGPADGESTWPASSPRITAVTSLPGKAIPRQLRASARSCAYCSIVFLVLGILFPLLPTPKRNAAEEAVPPRLARVMIEEKPKPPPPPPPVVEEKPKPKPEEEVARSVKPPVDRKQQAHEKAQKAAGPGQGRAGRPARAAGPQAARADQEPVRRGGRGFACRALADHLQGRRGQRRHHLRQQQPWLRYGRGLAHRARHDGGHLRHRPLGPRMPRTDAHRHERQGGAQPRRNRAGLRSQQGRDLRALQSRAARASRSCRARWCWSSPSRPRAKSPCAAWSPAS